MIRKDEEYADLLITGSEALALMTRKTLLIIVDNHRRSLPKYRNDRRK